MVGGDITVDVACVLVSLFPSTKNSAVEPSLGETLERSWRAIRAPSVISDGAVQGSRYRASVINLATINTSITTHWLYGGEEDREE